MSNWTPKKYSLFVNCCKTAQDLSRQTEFEFIELPPYAVDDNGKCINPTKFPKLIQKKEPFNVYKSIQSHADGVDFYKILQQVGNGEVYVKNPPSMSYGDFTNVPSSKLDAETTMLNLAKLNKILEGMIQEKQQTNSNNNVNEEVKESKENE